MLPASTTNAGSVGYVLCNLPLATASLKAYADQIRLRTYSALELISESDFEAGLRALQQAARAELVDAAVTAKIVLLVFER